ncbi:hypothetical protein GOP47_0009125 [Adiantum capillus-veneris]|uniref:Uncharacterized protein n=1 Tax=Adiantum capillus-veneris TaxID=13818 RepID=A0A9D4V095_ADICA|nr:hypothetical protein GOP47_0009125 [Adiantum capillus-veneris]
MASRALEASVELLCGSDLHSSSTSTSNSQSLLSLSPTFHFLKRAIVFSSTQHQSSWTTALPLVCRSSYGGAPNGGLSILDVEKFAKKLLAKWRYNFKGFHCSKD